MLDRKLDRKREKTDRDKIGMKTHKTLQPAL